METVLRIKRRSKPRRGRLIDRDYLDWMHTQPCMVSGHWPVTVHHVRRFGEPKDDRRTVPLMAEYHMHDFGMTSIERLGKENFEKWFKIDLEAEIVRYNEAYESQQTSSRSKTA